ncbi:hypothetical protein lbkm_2642 [Lachnospiraceae bacterium KM106-2]|nr:hypothetical protein lbkm_2642 [Lachnospiraceae bacterium KM106-2]
MKKFYLTSNIGGINYEEKLWKPCKLDNSNGFVDKLKTDWKGVKKGLILSSSPSDHMMNERFQMLYEKAFELSGVAFESLDLCDDRNAEALGETIYEYDVLILSGGHVPTENIFFRQIGLADLLENFEGIIIGISAGTMNCAEMVYAPPASEEEILSTDYSSYFEGLGVTKINVFPHFQEMDDCVVGGKRVIEDILIPDSKVRPFYSLIDGSYILIENQKETLYGETYLFDNGQIEKICEKDKWLEL